MFEVTCINLLNGVEFVKEFDSYFKVSKFMNRCKFSRKIAIVKVIRKD